MTNTNLLQAMGRIDPKLIADAAPDVPQKKSVNSAWVKWGAMAACLALVICIIPIAKLVFTGSNTKAPYTEHYTSITEVNEALSLNTLYSNFDFEITSAVMSFNSDENDEPMRDKPLQLLIRKTFQAESGSDNVHFYIIFNKSDVKDSYIAGYEEQGKTKEINGVTVHYSLIQDGAMHGQAKFIYDGHLYVIDVNSSGTEYNLDPYIDMVLNQIGGE